MHSLSILPLKVQYLTAPQLNFELNTLSCVLKYDVYTKSKKLGIGDAVCGSRDVGFSRLSRSLVSNRIGVCWGGISYYGCGRFLKLNSFGALVGLRWAMEEQEVEGECVREGSKAIHGVLGKGESSDVSEYSNDSGGVCDENGAKGKAVENTKGRGCYGDGKGVRIDVRALADRLKHAKTVDDVEKYLEGRCDVPLQVYSTIIRAFGKEKIIDSAVAIVQWLNRKKETDGVLGPNVFIYNSLLGAIKQSGKFEELEKVLDEMNQQGIVPNIVTYNILMVIYLEKGQPTEALNLFSEIQNEGIYLSPASYSTALSAYRKMEDGIGAIKFFLQFREKYQKGAIGKNADDDWGNEFVKLEKFTISTCYHVMRQWLIRDENLSTKVLKLLLDMDSAGLELSHADHERLVWACTREEHNIVARELYTRIRERHFDISLSVCNHVIWIMGKAKRWWAALEIYEDLLDKGPEPNNLSYELIMSHFNILLTAARKRGIWRWGVRLLNKMEEKGLKPESKQWDAVLIACSKASETSAAVQIFRRMIEKGHKATVVSYGALLSALEKGKLYDEARRVWEHMIKVGIKPNVHAYTIMASIFTRQGKFNLVDAIIREMTSSSVLPTVVTYNAIISACAYNGMSSTAYEWFHRMKVQNIIPNETTYEMLIMALASDGKPRLAFELYLRAQNEGLNLSLKAYDAITQSSQAYGATIDTSLLGPRPPETEKRLTIKETMSDISGEDDMSQKSEPSDTDVIYSIFGQDDQ